MSNVTTPHAGCRHRRHPARNRFARLQEGQRIRQDACYLLVALLVYLRHGKPALRAARQSACSRGTVRVHAATPRHHGRQELPGTTATRHDTCRLQQITMPEKRQVLDQLKRDELIAAADRFDVYVFDRRVRRMLVDALTDAKAVPLAGILGDLSRDRLLELCRALDLDDSGRTKAAFIERLASAPVAARPRAGKSNGKPAKVNGKPTPKPAGKPASGSNGHRPERPRGTSAHAVERPRQLTFTIDAPAPAAAVPAGPPSARLPRRASMSSGEHIQKFQSFGEASNFLWSIADLLRGDYKQHDYGKVILPFTVLRRLDCVLADTKEEVLARYHKLSGGSIKNLEPILNRVTGVSFHNISKLDFARLRGDDTHIAANLISYIEGFSENIREIFIERFKLQDQIQRLDDANLLYLVVKRFAEVDLHPSAVSNHMMGSIFEDLIRRFAEQSNETAGEHFTPREVIRLMVNLLFMEDDAVLRRKGVVKTLFDPACGTGGMLSVAEDYLYEINPDAQLEVFGQELNDESYAICKADMLLRAENPGNIALGNSFSQDGHVGRRFDYMLSNPPFGVEWKKVEKQVRDEHANLGHAGRFGAGLPRINDGSFLFLQHMISKMKQANEGGSRIAIVFNGSPLFNGDAGSGESEIRRWIIENDWLEAIVALPDQLFFNTGIHTYVWIVTNRKPARRRGKIQLIHAVDFFRKMRKSLGDKRNELGDDDIARITRLYGDFTENERSRIFANEDFGYRKIVVERPLRLSYQAAPERIERLKEEKAFQALATSKKKGAAGAAEIESGIALQERILVMLARMQSTAYKSRPAFTKALAAACKTAGLDLPAPLNKAIFAALSGRDEDAEICTDRHGNPEPDPDLRDTENVPLTEDIQTYFEREVKPHVPDAWIDEDKTRVGYEIPMARHFYKYQPPRHVGAIQAEIRTLEAHIQTALKEALS
jgi:type I restriction enzyme M protein